MPDKYDVIIIGAGPSGSYSASQLAATGHRVLVLEQKSGVGQKTACTGIVGRDCLAQFPQAQKAVSGQANSATLFSPSGNTVKAWRKEPQAFILDRPAFDRLLAQEAAGRGAQYLFDARAENVATNAEGMDVTVSCNSKSEILRAKAVVLATGFGSPLIGKLGLGKIADFAMGAQAEVEIKGIEETEVYFGQKVAPGFFGWLVPTANGRALAGVMSRHKPGDYLRSLLARLASEGKITDCNAEVCFGGIPLRPLPKTSLNRLLVVGDAAGQVKPTSGGGIYYSLLCAGIAADVLNRALETGDLSAGSLYAYERQWRKLLGAELRIGYLSRKLIERLSDRALDRMFLALDSRGIVNAMGASPDLSFDWHSKVILRMLRLLLFSR